MMILEIHSLFKELEALLFVSFARLAIWYNSVGIDILMEDFHAKYIWLQANRIYSTCLKYSAKCLGLPGSDSKLLAYGVFINDIINIEKQLHPKLTVLIFLKIHTLSSIN